MFKHHNGCVGLYCALEKGSERYFSMLDCTVSACEKINPAKIRSSNLARENKQRSPPKLYDSSKNLKRIGFLCLFGN